MKLYDIFNFRPASGKMTHCKPRCYNGRGKKCTCACDGVNHGVGFRQAHLNFVNKDEDSPLPDLISITHVPMQLTLFEQNWDADIQDSQ